MDFEKKNFFAQADLRWRLRAVYDRWEIIDLVNQLLSNGILKCLYKGSWQRDDAICLDALTKEEEKLMFWWIREERHWYRVV